MGAGKSSVGRTLARLWQTSFHDTDQAAALAGGSSVAELFQTKGEAHFRDLEQQAVAAALSEQPGVVALGGGALMRPANQAVLDSYRQAGGQVVFLDVSADQALVRIGDATSRPLLHGDGDRAKQRWVDLNETRRPAYQAACTLRIDTDYLDPIGVAQLISTNLPARNRLFGVNPTLQPPEPSTSAPSG